VTACTVLDGETSDRGLFDWAAPPGVTIEQTFVTDFVDDNTGRPSHSARYTAVCDCGTRGRPEKLRCDAINQLAATHRRGDTPWAG
jgi:hypothetical protein